MRICKKILCQIPFASFLLSFFSFYIFYPCVSPEEPFQGKRWETLYLGGSKDRQAAAAFLMWGKRQQWVPTHLHSGGFPELFQFLRISQFLHIYLSSAAFNKQKIKEDWADILLVLVCCSSAPIDSQDREVRNCPMIQKEKIEAKRKRKSLQGWQEIDERIY